MAETMNQEGYYTGVLDVYYALITAPDSPKTKPTYGDPKVLGKTIEVQITPNYKEAKVYASNVATRRERRVDTFSVRINADKIPYAVMKEILGRKVDRNGVQIVTGGQRAPELAIGFAMTLDDGSRDLRWFYKGTFAEMTQTAHTDSDTVTYQHPTIEGIFVRREYDDALQAVADTSDEAVGENVADDWFQAVYEETPVNNPGTSPSA